MLALVQPPPMRTYLTTRDIRRVGQWGRGVRAEETKACLKGNAGGSLRTPGPGHSDPDTLHCTLYTVQHVRCLGKELGLRLHAAHPLLNLRTEKAFAALGTALGLKSARETDIWAPGRA